MMEAPARMGSTIRMVVTTARAHSQGFLRASSSGSSSPAISFVQAISVNYACGAEGRSPWAPRDSAGSYVELTTPVSRCNQTGSANSMNHAVVGDALGNSLISRLNARVSMPLPDIHKMTGDRRRRRHGGRNEMGAASIALAALEIAVRGRGAALARRELVRVHR